jgi:hypothetical protein
VKIAEMGWIDDSIPEGLWAADKLRMDNSSWNIKIPNGLMASEYVLRTEIVVSKMVQGQTEIMANEMTRLFTKRILRKAMGRIHLLVPNSIHNVSV